MNLTRDIVLDSPQFKTILPHYLFRYRYSYGGIKVLYEKHLVGDLF